MGDEEQVLSVNELDLSFCEEVASQPGGEHIRRCFACGTCAAGCPVTEVDPAYNPRKIIRQVLFGMRAEVLSSPLIWYCQVCYRCYARCPQKVNFTDVMRALRYLAIKGRYASSDTLKRLEEVDRFSQGFRHDLIEYGFTGRTELLEALRGRVGDRLGKRQP
jgi:heterodisulfide reductase subunit C